MTLSKNGTMNRMLLLLLCGGALTGTGGVTWYASRGPGLSEKIETIASQTDDLWEWHNVTDPATGAKIWYVQQSLEDAIGKLATSIDTQTQVMRSLCDEFKDLRREIRP